MTDETTQTIEPVEATEATEAEPEARVPFWQRPGVDRYLAPLITPILVILGLVVYVLNVSRVFLSAHGHTSVVVGTVITVVILLGATVLSNSGRLRSSSIALMTAGFLLVVFSAGWLVLGHSQEKNSASLALTEAGPYQGTFKITAAPTGGLTFGPSSLTVPTGLYLVTFEDHASTPHTLDFDQSSTLWAGLALNNAGQTASSRIFFGKAGDYTFYCAIPGHRAAGMQGVVHVTGPPMTLAQATAASKHTATAAPPAK